MGNNRKTDDQTINVYFFLTKYINTVGKNRVMDVNCQLFTAIISRPTIIVMSIVIVLNSPSFFFFQFLLKMKGT